MMITTRRDPDGGGPGHDSGQHENLNVVAMLDCWLDPSDMYIAMECGGSNLSTIMRTQSERISTEHIQFFGYQILRALKFLHSAGIVHHDLRLSNIVCNIECDLQILVSDLAKVDSFAGERDRGNGGHVASDYHCRAPEVRLQPMDEHSVDHPLVNYDPSVDMWSVGCSITEIFRQLRDWDYY